MRLRGIAVVSMVAGLLGLAGCGGNTETPWLVNALRVLALRAEPPEAGPGDRVTLDALLADPAGHGRPLDVLWVACTPSLGRPENPCAGLAGGGIAGATTLPPPCATSSGSPLCIAGMRASVPFTVPSTALAGGVQGEKNQVTLLFMVSALAGGVPACIAQWKTNGAPPADCQVATKTLTVSSLPASMRNHNPTIEALALDGTALPAAGGPSLAASSVHALAGDFPSSDAEPEMGADGGSGMETLTFAWFADAGTLDRTLSAPTDVSDTFTAPAEQAEAGAPTGLPVTLWLVVRDDRGGVGWIQRQVYTGGPGVTAPDAGALDANGLDAPVPTDAGAG